MTFPDLAKSRRELESQYDHGRAPSFAEPQAPAVFNHPTNRNGRDRHGRGEFLDRHGLFIGHPPRVLCVGAQPAEECG